MPPSNLLLASKIVVVEEPPQIRNIPGAPTAIIALSGVAERGPIRVPQFLTSYNEFLRVFGTVTALSADFALAVEAAFRSGATAIWGSRVVHYTDLGDPLSTTADKGDQTIVDRGGVAGPAVLDSNAETFDLEPGEQLDLNFDGAGTDSLVFAAAVALTIAGNNEPYALINGDTIVYQVKMPGSATLSESRSIVFDNSDALIGAIGAVTAQEAVNVINRDGIGIKAILIPGGPNFRIESDKRGAGADLVVDAGSTAIAVGKFNIPSGTTSGSGNVQDVDAVTATEIAGLLTALPLSSGTALVAAGGILRLTSTGTGIAADVVVEGTTTAIGIFAGALPITQFGTNALESPSVKVIARTEGLWIVPYVVAIEIATSGDADRFNLRVTLAGKTRENWPNLSMDPTDARYVEDFLAANSDLIDAEDQFSPAVAPANLPKLGTFSAWANQDDGLVGLVDADYTGSQAGETGLFAFDQVSNITILAVPARATSAVHNAMIQYCEIERAGTCFAVLDPPAGLDAQGIKTYVETTAALFGLSEFAAIYWPRVKIQNPSTVVFGTSSTIVVAPSGHIVGTYARVDGARPGGVFVPPAGVEEGRLIGVLGFETDEVLDEAKRDVVFPSRINPLTQIDRSPRHIDGARTLKGDGNFPSVSERRGVIFIEVSLKQGLLFAKHRNNDRRLRMTVKRSIEAFLLIQFGNNAFRGETPAESFSVDVSDALNTIERIFAGELRANIGLATQKPAEFIILTFTQDTRQLEERLANELG